jgi:hypothetical protein
MLVRIAVLLCNGCDAERRTRLKASGLDRHWAAPASQSRGLHNILAIRDGLCRVLPNLDVDQDRRDLAFSVVVGHEWAFDREYLPHTSYRPARVDWHRVLGIEL